MLSRVSFASLEVRKADSYRQCTLIPTLKQTCSHRQILLSFIMDCLGNQSNISALDATSQVSCHCAGCCTSHWEEGLKSAVLHLSDFISWPRFINFSFSLGCLVQQLPFINLFFQGEDKKSTLGLARLFYLENQPGCCCCASPAARLDVLCGTAVVFFEGRKKIEKENWLHFLPPVAEGCCS